MVEQCKQIPLYSTTWNFQFVHRRFNTNTHSRSGIEEEDNVEHIFYTWSCELLTCSHCILQQLRVDYTLWESHKLSFISFTFRWFSFPFPFQSLLSIIILLVLSVCVRMYAVWDPNFSFPNFRVTNALLAAHLYFRIYLHSLHKERFRCVRLLNTYEYEFKCIQVMAASCWQIAMNNRVCFYGFWIMEPNEYRIRNFWVRFSIWWWW